MELLTLLEELRARYLRQFEAVYQEQAAVHEQVAAEIAFELADGPYKRLFVVDVFGQSDGANSVIEVGATKEAYGGDVSIQYKDLSLEFVSVSWGAMRFLVEPKPKEIVGFEAWFDKWIDLEGQGPAAGQVFSRIIHSARLDDGMVAVDFGSAPVDAAFELFDLFATNDVTLIKVESDADQ